MYADRIYHWHAHLGMEDGPERAAAQFRRALEILRNRHLSPATRRRVLREDYQLQMLRGRPTAAVRIARQLEMAQADEPDYPRLG
ncbi:MAG: hypothetical protein ACR2GQ_02950 [Gemmatimonadota bacterium]|jgi:hypothetical protein